MDFKQVATVAASAVLEATGRTWNNIPQAKQLAIHAGMNAGLSAADAVAAAFHSDAGNGTKQDNFSHIPSVYKETIPAPVPVPEPVPEPAITAEQQACIDKAANVPQLQNGTEQPSAYARMKQAERDYYRELRMQNPHAYSLSDTQYTDIVRSIVDAVWNGTELPTQEALADVPVQQRHAVLSRPGQLRRTVKAINACSDHPAIKLIQERHGKRGVNSLGDTSLSKCIGNIRRVVSDAREMSLLRYELWEVRQTVSTHSLEIAELKARIEALEASCVPSDKSGTERNSSKAADRAAVKARIIELVKQGVPYSAIAKQEGVGTGTISRWVNAH